MHISKRATHTSKTPNKLDIHHGFCAPQYHALLPGFTSFSTLRNFCVDRAPPARCPIPSRLFTPVTAEAAFGVAPLAIKVGGRNAEFADLGGAVDIVEAPTPIVELVGGLVWTLAGFVGCEAVGIELG